MQLVDGRSGAAADERAGVEDRAPAWSPDGQRLAFTRAARGDCRIFSSRRSGAKSGRSRPAATRSTGGSPGLPTAPGSPSPGATTAAARHRAAFTRHARAAPPYAASRGFSATLPRRSRPTEHARVHAQHHRRRHDLYRVPVEGGEPTRLTFDNRDTMGPTWSEDGKSLVFSSSRAGIYSLWRVTARGGEPTWVAGGGIKMKHPSTARAKDAPRIRELALRGQPLARARPARALRPRLSPPPRLTAANDEWNFEPHVSPDGRRVAFVSTRSGSEEIWVAGATATATKLTSFGGARLETPRWSPDGRRLVFSARPGARRLCRRGRRRRARAPDDRNERRCGAVLVARRAIHLLRLAPDRRVAGLAALVPSAARPRSRATEVRGAGVARRPRSLFHPGGRARNLAAEAAGGPASRVVAASRRRTGPTGRSGRDGIYFRELRAGTGSPRSSSSRTAPRSPWTSCRCSSRDGRAFRSRRTARGSCIRASTGTPATSA